MKKILALIIAILLTATIIVGCSSTPIDSGRVQNNKDIETEIVDEEDISSDQGSNEESVAANTENSSDEVTDASNNNIENTEVQITVTVPDGWEVVEGSVLPVQYMKNTASFMIKEASIN